MLTAAEYARIAIAADEVAGEIEAGTLVPGRGCKWTIDITNRDIPWCSIGHIEDRAMCALYIPFFVSESPIDLLRDKLLTVVEINDAEPRDVGKLVAALRALAARARELAGERRGQ